VDRAEFQPELGRLRVQEEAHGGVAALTVAARQEPDHRFAPDLLLKTAYLRHWQPADGALTNVASTVYSMTRATSVTIPLHQTLDSRASLTIRLSA
jgi:hypothetical protein